MGLLKKFKSIVALRRATRLRVSTATLAALTLVLAGCSQRSDEVLSEARDTAAVTPSGTTVFVSADALVSTDDLRLAGLPNVGLDAQGKVRNLLDATVTEVPVLCIFRSSDGQSFSQTVNWERSAGSLTLTLESFPLTLPNGIDFSSAGGRTWYMCGFIGGELDAANSRIKVAQTALHSGLVPLESSTVSQAVVPYAFPWTKLSFVTKNGTELAAPTRRITFHPQGTIIRLKLGNNLAAGTHGINAKAIAIQTNAWGDEGYFDFSSGAVVEGELPQWSFTDTKTVRAMKYTLAAPHALAGGTLVDEAQTYLLWVMPTGVTQPSTQVVFGGEYQNSALTLPTPYFLTDYAPKAGVQVRAQRQYTLTARVASRVRTPLEYITEHSISAPWLGRAEEGYIEDPSTLRTAVPAGQHIPTSAEAASVFPMPANAATNTARVDTWATTTYMGVQETLRWGDQPTATYTSDFESAGDGITYAIRFQGSLFRTAWRYEWDSGASFTMIITTKWIPFWEDVTLANLRDATFWSSGDIQTVQRTFLPLGDQVIYPGGGQGPYGVMNYFAYWGLESDGTLFVYGNYDYSTTGVSVGTWLDHAFPIRSGYYWAISLYLRPFYDSID